MPIRRKTLPDGQETMPGGVADAAGLMGPLGVPGAVAGMLGKIKQLSPEDAMTLHELLGKPIQMGRRLLRLSSVNPEKNTAILHDATSGQRMASPIDDFLKAWRKIGADTAEQFPEGSVMSQPGQRVTNAVKISGPRGGISPIKRKIPPTATR